MKPAECSIQQAHPTLATWLLSCSQPVLWIILLGTVLANVASLTSLYPSLPPQDAKVPQRAILRPTHRDLGPYVHACKLWQDASRRSRTPGRSKRRVVSWKSQPLVDRCVWRLSRRCLRDANATRHVWVRFSKQRTSHHHQAVIESTEYILISCLSSMRILACRHLEPTDYFRSRLPRLSSWSSSELLPTHTGHEAEPAQPRLTPGSVHH
nr:hypothetical protein CFP56_10363 [Quercus suber]